MQQTEIFTIKIDKWKKLLPENNHKAQDFYLQEVFPYIVDNFETSFSDKTVELDKFKNVISILGSSPYPAILFIKAIKPEKVLFICSEDTKHNLDIIYEKTELRLSQIEKENTEIEDEINTTYKVIKKFCNVYRHNK